MGIGFLHSEGPCFIKAIATNEVATFTERSRDSIQLDFFLLDSKNEIRFTRKKGYFLSGLSEIYFWGLEFDPKNPREEIIPKANARDKQLFCRLQE